MQIKTSHVTSDPGGHRVESSYPQPDCNKDQNFWRETFSSELQEIGVHLSPTALKSTVDGANIVGSQLRKAWTDIPDGVDVALDKVPTEFSTKAKVVSKTLIQVAKGLGYTAAGLQGVSGAYKLITGIQSDSLARKIDGVFDLTAAAAVATTVAGAAIGPWVLAPLSVATGVVRGAYNGIRGYVRGNGRQEIQGALDATRSASVGLRMAGYFSPGLNLAGKILGPVGGALQLGRGLYDFSKGLEVRDLSKQVRGLADMTTAVGLTLALTGVATLPGIAVAAVGLGTTVSYPLVKPFKVTVNKVLGCAQRPLRKAQSVLGKVTKPLAKVVRPIFQKLFRTKRGSRPSKPCDGSKA